MPTDTDLILDLGHRWASAERDADVGDRGDGAATALLDVGGDAGEGLVVARAEHDGVAVAREGPGGVGADAAAGPGDQGDPVARSVVNGCRGHGQKLRDQNIRCQTILATMGRCDPPPNPSASTSPGPGGS